jgi:hypothetical protein
MAPRSQARVFNAERDAALRQGWEAGLRASEILPKLNAIPGFAPVSSVQSLIQRAMKLKLARPEGWKLHRLAQSAPKVWSGERRAMLAERINKMPDAELFAALNALPGHPIKNASAMREKAQHLGFLRGAAPQPPHIWTVARRTFLAQHYGRLAPKALLEALRELPGDPILHVDSIRRAANRFGYRSARQLPPPIPPRRMAAPRPEPAPEPDEPPPLTPEEQEAAVAAALERKHASAMKMFAQGKSPDAVAASIKVPLREACRLLGEYRNQVAQRKAA